VVVDDFRSGDFRNCRLSGDFVAADISRLDWPAQFKDLTFDGIFHEASITDTTVHDQFLQVHDNVEAFAPAEFRGAGADADCLCLFGSHLWIGSTRMREDQAPAPANVYAFTKVQLDNLARTYSRRSPAWRIVGARYFNVYGPARRIRSGRQHDFQLYQQMKAGKRRGCSGRRTEAGLRICQRCGSFYDRCAVGAEERCLQLWLR